MLFEAESSTATKWSRHLTVHVPKRAFVDNASVGMFVKRHVLLHPKAAGLRVDRDAGDPVCIVDHTVYSRCESDAPIKEALPRQSTPLCPSVVCHAQEPCAAYYIQQQNRQLGGAATELAMGRAARASSGLLAQRPGDKRFCRVRTPARAVRRLGLAAGPTLHCPVYNTGNWRRMRGVPLLTWAVGCYSNAMACVTRPPLIRRF